MEQLSVPSMNQLYLGSQVLQGLMEEEEEDGLVCTVQPPLLDVVLSGSSPLPGLSFSTPPYCSAASLPLCLFPSPLGPLFAPSKAFSDAKRTHTSKQQHAPSHQRTLTKTDTETDQKEDEEAHTIRKSPKGCLILSVLSSLYHPQPIILSYCPAIPLTPPRKRFCTTQRL